MAETTGGLPTEKDDTEVPVKGSTKVGKYVFPTASGDTKLSNSILEQMEALYQKKLQEGRGLLSGLKDAAALSMAARPGGSSAYLQQREQQKADRAADLFNIRAQMAQYKAAQEAQQRFETERGELLGTTPPAAGTAPTTAGGMGIDLTSDERLALSRARTREEFNKLLNSFVTERTKARLQPSAQEAKYEVQYYDDNGNVVYNVVDLPTKQRLERSGRLVDVSAPRTAPKAAAPAPAAPAPAPTTAAPEAKKTSGQYLFEDISPEMLTNMEKFIQSRDPNFNVSRLSSPSAKESFNAMPLDKRKRLFEGISDEQPAMKLASAELPAPLEKPEAPEMPAGEPTQIAQAAGIPTIPQQRTRLEVEKQSRLEEAKEQAQKFREFLTAIDPPVAADRASTAQEIIDLTKSRPDMVGILQKPGIGPAIAELLVSGISAPGGHSVAMKGLEEALVRAFPGTRKEDLEVRDRLRTLLEKTAFHMSNIIKGQGQVTEFERILLQQVAGSIRSAPGNLIKIQEGLLARANLDQKLGEMYNRSGLTYGEFKKTKEYTSAVKEYENKLKSIRDAALVSPSAPGSRGGATPPGPFSDPAKEKEYQEWKRRQLQKGNK